MAQTQALSESVLASSKEYNKYINKVNYLLLILAIVSIYTVGTSLYIASSMVVLLQLAIWYMLLESEKKKVIGQTLIRHDLIEKGFDEKFPAKLSYLKSQLTDSESDSAKYLERDDYYAIPADTDKRFLSMLKESCFWTTNLYQNCYQEEKSRVVFMSLLFLILLMSVAFIDLQPDENFSLQRTFMVIIGTFPLWQSIKDSLKFDTAKDKLKAIDSELEAESKSISELLMLFSEYSVITSSTPLIPDELYVKHKDRIQENWDVRIANTD